MKSIQTLSIIAGIGLIVGVVTQTHLLPRWYSSQPVELTRIFTPPETTPTPQPNPVPFESMTIPYLRNRTYQSQLGTLNQIAQNSNYTTFLTSYTSDDLRINGLLTIPTGATPDGGWPAIVLVHGYIPPSQYRTQERYQDHVNSLARSGFVVFKIDLRGHGNSEGEASGAYYSGDYVIDTLNARAALADSDFVHPDKIGLWGHSMAGNVVFRSLVAQPDIPVGVIWAGAVYTYQDFREYRISDNSYQPPSSSSPRNQERQRLFDLYGEFDANHPFWRTVVPTHYLDDVSSHLQLHHAQDDAVVSPDYSTNLDRILDGTPMEHEVFIYASGGHNISGNSFSEAMARTIEFFRKHLE